MFCQSLALGLLGSRVAYALKEPYTLVYPATLLETSSDQVDSISFRTKCLGLDSEQNVLVLIQNETSWLRTELLGDRD